MNNSFCIFSGGLASAIQVKGVIQGFKPLGYPNYFISLIGVWKVLGIIAIFVYHNGAESYYAARGFRGSLKV